MPRIGTILKISAVVAAIGVMSGTVPAVVGSSGPAASSGGPAPDPAVLKIVYQVGRNHDASDPVMLAAFEACAVESSCRNLDHGHADSLGVFQQRPSMGWGSPAEVTDVRYASRQFFVRANAAEGCCATSGQLAQHVQRSAYPDRYDQAEGRARVLMAKAARLNGATP
jgi:hypothetical protein